jgi:hypothetical protein
MMATDKIELPIGYYLENFRRLVEHATHQYADLLSAEETHWLSQFDRLSVQAQRLIVRLLTRKGVWFRSDKLQYGEIPDLDPTLAELEAIAFIELNPELSPFDLGCSLLTKAEIVGLYPQTDKQLKKEQLLEQLSTNVQPYQCPFTIVQLLHSDILDTLQLLFFANTHQDQSQFILEDLGLHAFENYALDNQNRFFQHREQVESLRLFSAISSQYYTQYRALNGIQKLDVLNQWSSSIESELTQYDDPATHGYTHVKRQGLLNTLARDFERLGDLDRALAIFETTQLPPSRERRARMYLQRDQVSQAATVITDMLANPFSIEESEVAVRLEVKLKRAQGQKVPRQAKPHVDEDRLELDLSSQRVELAAAEYYQSKGYSVFYVENAFICGLFGLLYWDAIFAPVEGAFINAYQAQPKNLYSSRFESLRIEQLSRCREQFQQQGYRLLFDKLTQKQGILNPFVYWQHFDENLLSEAERYLPIETVLKLTDIILNDRKAFRAGMPDLVAFKDNATYWIEVKGPGDKLQDNQWRWIKHFQALQLPIRVCYVNQ